MALLRNTFGNKYRVGIPVIAFMKQEILFVQSSKLPHCTQVIKPAASISDKRNANALC